MSNTPALRHPLTSSQAEVWLAQTLLGDSSAYNLSDYIEIHGPVDATIFEAALRQMLAETPALGVAFKADALGVSQQPIEWQSWRLPCLDFSQAENPSVAAEQWMQQDCNQPFEQEAGPLFRYALLKISEQHYFWYQCLPHIAMDGWGNGLLVQRVAHLYTAMSEGCEPAASPFGDFGRLAQIDADYRASSAFQEDRAFWLEYCATLPPPASLSPRQEPMRGLRRHRLRLSGPIVQRLRDSAKTLAIPLPQLLISIIAAYLQRISGQQELSIGIPVAARSQREQRAIPGMLANALPMRLQVRPDMTIGEVARQVSRQVRQSLRRQQYRYEDMLRDQQGQTGRGHLFTTTINVVPYDHDLRFAGHGTTPHNLANGPAVDLGFDIFDRSDDKALEIGFNANAAHYDAPALEHHMQRLLQLMRALGDNPTQTLGDIELLSDAEREALLAASRGPELAVAADTLPALFERQAVHAAHSIAVQHGELSINYAELNAQANRLAHQLIADGVGPEDIVAFCLPRSLRQVVVLLAIAKAGAAYLPLDPHYPPERLRLMLEDAQPRLLLSDGDWSGERPAGLAQQNLDQPEFQAALQLRSAADPDDGARRDALGPANIAYVIYTSGSTGQPKGVLVSHAGIANLAAFQSTTLEVGPGSRVLQFSSISFDASFWEIAMALLSGATLVMADHEEQLPGPALERLLRQEEISHLTLSPSALANLSVEALPQQLRLIVAGEACPPALAGLFGLQRKMFNGYGPTEATVCATLSQLDGDGSAPIGTPLPNVQAYVLDAKLQPLPVGVAGELYIAGVSLARGYLNRPALTAERFIANPFEPGERMYRTGDLARWTDDGRLEHLGRVDQQVKVRGFRVELGEIEAALAQHPTVASAAVILYPQPSGHQALAAYVVAQADARAEPAQLRQYLAQILPDYMVPSSITLLDSMPLSPNGKLNRQALPEPAQESGRDYRAPRTPPEEILCGLYAEILGLNAVGIDDSFFELGGHSLLATRLISRIRSIFQLELGIRSLFEAPSVAALAQRISQAQPENSFAILLPLQPKGERAPLFCIHPAGGLGWPYAGLIRHLPGDQPLYALQARSLSQRETCPESVDEMAADYLRQIRAVQPQGPYHLLGWSFGGHIAHAMAILLQQQGERVALLSMLDNYPLPSRLFQPEDLIIQQRLMSALSDGAVAPGEDYVARVREHLGMSGLDAGLFDAILREFKAAPILMNAHDFQCFDGDLLFFRASEDPLRDEFQTPEAWQAHICGDIVVHSIACLHEKIMRPEALTHIGPVLAAALRQAQEAANPHPSQNQEPNDVELV